MRLTDTQLRNFDQRKLRVGRDKRNDLLKQVRNLIGKLETHIPENSVFKVERFRRAGSLPKATVLFPRGEEGIDADIVVYLNTDGVSDYDRATMLEQLRQIADNAYPTKDPSDFKVQPRTVGILFRESGLAVDLVPVIAVEGETDEAWMVSSNGTKDSKTNPPAHIIHARERADGDSRYRPLVRIGKFWRNRAELKPLGSFAIELVMGEIQCEQGPAPSLEEGLLRFFQYIAQTELKTPILSGHSNPEMPTDPVVILDPAVPENNVTSWISEIDREEIVQAATTAWETLHLARTVGGKGETLDLWREVFGSSFTIEAEAVAA